MYKYKKILVVCPAGAVTGGPEALHQLVAHMNSFGLSAFMCYTPFSIPSTAPFPYEHYKTQSATYEDEPGNLIIFPEIEPMLALKVQKAQGAIWWLSLENFLERRHFSPMYDKIRYIKRIFQNRRPLRGARSLKKLLHFSQTEHSTQYLRSCGIDPIPLIDSINEDFLTKCLINDISLKQNVILYNPTKGWKVTSILIRAFPKFLFQPVNGLNRNQLSDKFSKAKLYIDFGHHPGRDRLPREAAMHGCCIITGILGSANNDIDIPIPRIYKLDSNLADFKHQFEILVSEIFNDFPSHYSAFDQYRNWLKNEPIIFKNQIKDFFTI